MALMTSGSTDTSRYPTPAPSVARMFYDRVAATPHAEAYRHPTAAGWASVTWAQTEETVRTMAAGLLALGILPEQRVAVASATRIEWLYADLAIMCAGGGDDGRLSHDGGEDVAYILADSGTRIVFAEDDAQVAKLRAERDHLPDVVRVVIFDGQRRRGVGAQPGRPARLWAPKHLAEHTERRSTRPWRRSSPSTWPR